MKSHSKSSSLGTPCLEICAIPLRIPTVHCFTRKIHAHIREQKISCAYFFQPVRKIVIAT